MGCGISCEGSRLSRALHLKISTASSSETRVSPIVVVKRDFFTNAKTASLVFSSKLTHRVAALLQRNYGNLVPERRMFFKAEDPSPRELLITCLMLQPKSQHQGRGLKSGLECQLPRKNGINNVICMKVYLLPWRDGLPEYDSKARLHPPWEEEKPGRAIPACFQRGSRVNPTLSRSGCGMVLDCSLPLRSGLGFLLLLFRGEGERGIDYFRCCSSNCSHVLRRPRLPGLILESDVLNVSNPQAREVSPAVEDLEQKSMWRLDLQPT